MSLVISSALVLADTADGLSLDHPVIGWRNVVTAASIAADTEADGHPAVNLANQATYLYWQADDTSEQYITITIDSSDLVDYVAVARHNFGSAAIPVSIEAFIGGVWTEIVEEVILPNDDPALFRFVGQVLPLLRIRMQSGDIEARAAVVYCGKLLVLERKVWVGHVPLPHGIRSNIANGRSESGEFLGRVVLGEWRESTLPLSLLTPAWFRANFEPFLRAGRHMPFFFAWRPQTYPREIGFGCLVNDPDPAPVGPSNLIACELKLSGVA